MLSEKPYLSTVSLLVLISPVVGCGSRQAATYPVSGTVRFEDGRPVPVGVIEFRHEFSGLTARGKLDDRGEFRLGTYRNDDGAPAGNYRVVLIQHFAVPHHAKISPLRAAKFEHAHEAAAGVQVDTAVSSYSTTQLRADIRPDTENRLSFVVRRQENCGAKTTAE
jgi:hypothetical protein